MRLLILTCTPKHYMAPPALAEHQVIAGPAWPDVYESGCWVSMKTPSGEYDIVPLIDKLPPHQRPDAVVCLVDASWRNAPRNLGAFSGPKVLLIADTHHMWRPISATIRYVELEPFDRIVLLYDRHHLELFRGGTSKKLFWFPGLTFPFSDADVEKARRAYRENHIAFFGSLGRFHPRRMSQLGAMQKAGIAICAGGEPQATAFSLYGQALVGFNTSLNGDLNLRVFEIMGAGGMVLTDRLSESAGMSLLWQEGEELATYGSTPELIEKARYYLEHPGEARAIARSGEKWFDEKFSESHRRRAFESLVFDGLQPEQFPLVEGEPAQWWFPSCQVGPEPAVRMYERLQDLHREFDLVTVLIDASVPGHFMRLCQTLPRLQVVPLDGTDSRSCEGATAIVLSQSAALSTKVNDADLVWVWDLAGSGVDALLDRLADQDFVPLENESSVFVPINKELVATPRRQGAEAAAYLARNDRLAAFSLARSAFRRNPQDLDALLVLAGLALDSGNLANLEAAVSAARQLAPNDSRVVQLVASLETERQRKPRPL